MNITLIAIGDRTENYAFRLFKSILEEAGFSVQLLYLNIGHLHDNLSLNEKLKQQLSDFLRSTSLVCLYVFTFNFRLAIMVTKICRRVNAEMKVIWGGPHCIAAPDTCTPHADAVCVREGEDALMGIAYGMRFEDIPNIAYLHNGEYKINDICPPSIRLDDLPFQDYSLRRHYYIDDQNDISPLTIDAVKKKNGGIFTYIAMIGRGCPYHCGFCINSGKRHIPYQPGRSVDNVIEELKQAKEKYTDQIDEIMFYDDDFFALPIKYIRKFSARYKSEIGIPLHELNTVCTSFSVEKLECVRYMGAKGIIVGMQSISRNGRQAYRHPATKAGIQAILKIMKRYPDMNTVLHLILGNPYEIEDDIVENLLFLDSLPMIYELSNYQLIIYPGTALHDKIKKDGICPERLSEGCVIPYYYQKPELKFWNFLCSRYLYKRQKLPRYIRKLLEKRHYAAAKIISLYKIKIFADRGAKFLKRKLNAIYCGMRSS